MAADTNRTRDVWDQWLRAAVGGRAVLAAELREMYLALLQRQDEQLQVTMAPTSCAACNDTLQEITRLRGQLQAHRVTFAGEHPAEGQ